MKVLLPQHSGFCPGVKRAEKRILNEKSKRVDEPLFVCGNLIHNKRYTAYLEENNIFTEGDIDSIPDGATVFIRTHGIKKQTEGVLKKRFKIVDLTCPTVKKLQLQIESYSNQGYYIIVTGKKSHPEVEGLASYADKCAIVESMDELTCFLSSSKELPGDRVYIVSQTTGKKELFTRVAHNVRERLGDRYKIECYDSTCPITTLREKQARSLQQCVDATIVVGDKSSSNATKLFTILKEIDSHTFFIEDIRELKSLHLPLQSYSTVQVVSSSSTPVFIEDEIITFLSDTGSQNH